MEQQEIRRKMGKDKELEKKETKNTAKTATILWRLSLAIPIEVTATLYIYANIWQQICGGGATSEVVFRPFIL